MSLPAQDDLRELLGWEPAEGVLSVYVHIDHADRGGGWRIALGDALRETVREHGETPELRATADRVLERLGGNGRPPDGRGHLCFAEIGSRQGEDRWFTSSAYPRLEAVAVAAKRPHVQPLVEMLDDHRRRGVVAVTGERARLLEWQEARLDEVDDREILTTGDWRDRKGQRNVDIPSGQAPTSSGRDQHEQRLEDHRRRFVGELADDVADTADERGWSEILCFGEAKYLSELEERLGVERIAYAEEKNLLTIPDHELTERLSALTTKLNRRREITLIERAEEAALAGGRGALGLAETAQALAEGRVEHLLIAAAELPATAPEEVSATLGNGTVSGQPLGELLIERALQTSAAITPVEEEAAERLAEREGAAAILRY